MRKLKEVLRLHSLGLSQHQIARSCSISQSTVHEYLSTAQAAGVKWPAPENWNDQQIERTLFPQRPAPAIWRKHPNPDWTQSPPRVTDAQGPDPWVGLAGGPREQPSTALADSRFCKTLYRRWFKKARPECCARSIEAARRCSWITPEPRFPIHNPESGEVLAAAVW